MPRNRQDILTRIGILIRIPIRIHTDTATVMGTATRTRMLFTTPRRQTH